MNYCTLITLLAVVLLTACSASGVGSQPTPTQTASSIPTAMAEASATVVAITPSPATLLATETTIPSTKTEAALAASQEPQMVQIFLVALEDQGISGKKIGCGDSAVPVQMQIPPTQGVLKAALEALLSVKAQYYGESGLYNALYQSDLQLESATIENGKAVVNLRGTLQLGGECDNPRVAAQLEETVLQFPTVKEAAIFINGKPLYDVLSLRG
jgi:Sporulation and spore germination